MTRAAGVGLRWREDEELVETVTQLTGSGLPWLWVGLRRSILRCRRRFSVTPMRDHQKYFAVEGKDGKLAHGIYWLC